MQVNFVLFSLDDVKVLLHLEELNQYVLIYLHVYNNEWLYYRSNNNWIYQKWTFSVFEFIFELLRQWCDVTFQNDECEDAESVFWLPQK